MTRSVSFDPAACRELEEAADFYDFERPGLGAEFLAAVQEALRELTDFPESYPVLLGKTRKLVVGRFPYSIMYWLDGDDIVVSAIAHQSRRPGYWRDRT